MPINPQETIYYKRARFTTRLPLGRMYDRSHFWRLEMEPDLYRVGLTKFATRMLGDLVEVDFQAKVGAPVTFGQVLGTIEGFKAVSELYSMMEGEFAGLNTELMNDPTLLDSDPYDAGWLYLIRGTAGETSLDVQGYIALLDATVDQMLEQQGSESKGKPC